MTRCENAWRRSCLGWISWSVILGIGPPKWPCWPRSNSIPAWPPCLPNLRLVQKLGAGVDGIVRDPDLPDHVRVCRLKPDGPAVEIAEYFLTHVLSHLQNLSRYQQQAGRSEWRQHPPRQSRGTTVAVLGLGHIGATVAATFARLGFRVLGWSRSAKTLPDVECHHGESSLDQVLSEADFCRLGTPIHATDRGIV